MSSSPLYSRPGISGILLLVFLTGIIIGAHSFVQGYYLEDSKKSQHARLSVFKTSLVAELKRFDYLPEVIAQNPSITYSLEESPDQTSSMLLDLQQTAGVEAIYVLSRDGLTLASSNYQDSGSFVGKNYGFRPYFREALSQGYGRFYGIGATTRRPGYFVAAPIPEKNSAKAVVAVKFELGSLENSWASEEEHVFVSDKNGVINLSSTEEWRYKTLYPLTPGQLDELREQKQFADEPLPVLDHQSEDAGIGLVMINGEKFLESIVEIDVAGWRLHSLLPYQQVRQQLISFWTRVLAAGLILIAALLAVRIVRTRVALQQSLGESLKLRQLNQSLEQEIEERKRAESALLQAQKDLKLNSKLAAMGQLAASITHELNQPLAAMRTYTVSLKESLDTSLSSGKSPTDEFSIGDTKTTVSKLSSLIDRMTTVTQQLRVFARSRNNETQRIDLKKAIEETLVAMQPILAGSNVESFIETPPEPVWVMAGRVRIEQVLVNLLKNAIDAMQETGEQSQKHVYIKLRPTDNHRVELSVADTGPGIKEEVINSLFEPFESTKPSGQGMGLGLAISNSIIAEIKGEMRAENRAEGGALFTILIDGAD